MRNRTESTPDLYLVIDTNRYAGGFERELLVAATGVMPSYPTGSCKTLASLYKGPDLDSLVGSLLNDPGDDAVGRDRVSIYPTPGWTCVRGKEVRVTRSQKFVHPAYMSVRIPLERTPSKRVLDGIKRRALAFAASGTPIESGDYQDVPPFTITGFRLLTERTVAEWVAA